MTTDVNLIPGIGYFASGNGRTMVYTNEHDLLLNLDGEYTDWQMEAFLKREFPNGLTQASTDKWLGVE